MRSATRTPILSASRLQSPIGELLAVACGDTLCGLWFADQKGIPPWALQAPMPPSPTGVLLAAQQQLNGYFSGTCKSFDLPLDFLEGTDFQRTVWSALRQIPYGHTRSYGQLAEAIGRPRAVRALGGAVGRNPLGILLPCHRVVGHSGALTGYTGGLDRKLALLRLEGAL